MMTFPSARPGRPPGLKPSTSGQADLDAARALFPALDQKVHGKPLVYLDSAATTQKPRVVIDAVVKFYESDNANVHRGVHALGDRATAALERARATVQRFLNARRPHEIIFVRGTTEAVNLVAQTFGRANVGRGDEVLVTEMEHHGNFVPWQRLCEEKGAVLRALPINDRGELRLDTLEELLSARTKLVALSHVSNVLGTVNPVKEVIEAAHKKGIPVLVDGAQAASHVDVDVQDLDCDFYAFSGHKVYGPMGIGVLYGKLPMLDAMPPWQSGGDMVKSVGFEGTTFNDPPHKFEAGTPNVAGAVGLATALEFLDGLGRRRVAAHEANLLDLAVKRLRAIPGVRLIGDPKHRAGVVSFLVEDPPMSPLDVGARLDVEGIAVRTGHHCAMPLMTRLGVSGTVRASFALYNTAEEVERLASSLRSVVASAAQAGRAAAQARIDGPEYPEATASNVGAAAAALRGEFDGLDDWAEKYELLIELGRRAPIMPEALKTKSNKVRGCLSTVHMTARLKPGSRDVVEFLADSDSELVRGLLALLQHLFSGQRAAEILAFDLPGFLARVGLESNLTSGRRNGFAEMIKRLLGLATELTASSVG